MSLPNEHRVKIGWFLFLTVAVFVWGCLDNERKPDTFDLPAHFVDSLSGYDRVLIILRDTSGEALDTLFKGKVQTESQLKNLSAPHYPGGKMVITIIGYIGGQVVYNTDRIYNGADGETEAIKPIVLPTTRIKIEKSGLQVMVKGFSEYPLVSIQPENLTDNSLIWKSSNDSVLRVEKDRLVGIRTGSVFLTVVLHSDTSKHDEIKVEVTSNPMIPDSLRISADTLKLAAHGRDKQLTFRIYPPTASSGIFWMSLDSSIATVAENGYVVGVTAGKTRVTASTLGMDVVSDSAWVLVSDPKPVDSVRFADKVMNIFVGGSAESLIVQVSPPEANDALQFTIRNEAIAMISNGKISGQKEGETWVVVKSSENISISDSIKVFVLSSKPVERVDIPDDSITLFIGGASKTLVALVSPAQATSWVRWRSLNTSVATVDSFGSVSPVAPGRTRIASISRVDSTRKDSVIVLVKKDVPHVNVGGDTVISLGQSLSFFPLLTQEYGMVALFKWDLNGDGNWDDSSTALKSVSYNFDQEKEYPVSFYVRDSEGNDTTVVKKIKVVKGPAVAILSPLNNSYTNQFTVNVIWSINGKTQDSLQKETLRSGVNTVTRAARDGAGKLFETSITVNLDTVPPIHPSLHGDAITNTQIPTWTWTGGGGGNGVFRLQLDGQDFSKAGETKDTLFEPATDLAEGVHTLFVQERDAAGNWSQSGRLAIRIDVTAPLAPKLSVTLASPTNNRRPEWNWTGGGNGGMGTFRFRLDNTLLNGATETDSLSFAAAQDLSEGVHTLYVQERDSAGNWSPTASNSIVIDLSAPEAPIVRADSWQTTNPKPIWHWSSGGNGGIGSYRYKLDDSAMQTGAILSSDTNYIPSVNFNVGSKHTLYVQERDEAGNWSAIGLLAIRVHGQTGFAVGDGGTILRTTNAGASWDTVSRVTSGYLTSVYFPDVNNGYAVSDVGNIISTVNGGLTWRHIAKPTAKALNSVYFLNASTGYAVGNGIKVKTSNSGATWDTLPGESTQFLQSLTFTDAKIGYAVGGNGGVIVKTTDGGSSWIPPTGGSGSSLTLFSVFFPNAKIGYAVGFFGVLVKTVDGGATWKALSNPTSETLNSVYFTDDKIGYAVGENGTILKTINGGITWDALVSHSNAELISVFFIDSNTGFAVGRNGTILKTANGGIDWSQPTLGSGTTVKLGSVFFP